MTTLYIIRGISGSGKTTLAQQIAKENNCRYVEADMWFTREDGSYVFDPRELPRAHEWCLACARHDIKAGYAVVVANTFTTEWEMQEYVRCGLLHEYRIVIIECRGRYQNTHGLTEAMIARQLARFESNEEIKARNSRYDNTLISFMTYE